MAQRKFEDRITTGKIAVRQGAPAGVYGGPGPVLPPLHTRGGPDEDGHPAASVIHSHPHGDLGRKHEHMHVHSGDNRHSGPDHKHVPGNAGGGTPAAQLNARPSGGETRDAGLEDIDLAAAIAAYLKSEGVDIGRTLADASYEREHAGERAKERAARAQDLARSLRKAKRALSFEQENFVRQHAGSGIGLVGEAQQRVGMLTAALAETLGHDAELIAEANRRAAR
jgi:hypothetical protein